MANGQGNQLAHGYPGTPVGDLFPLGQAVLGSGAESSLRPIRAGELRSHSAPKNTHASGAQKKKKAGAGATPRCRCGARSAGCRRSPRPARREHKGKPKPQTGFGFPQRLRERERERKKNVAGEHTKQQKKERGDTKHPS